MREFKLQEIGKVSIEENTFRIQLEEAYAPGLQGIDGFSHLHIIWWADEFDNPEMRSLTQSEKPYKQGPDILGIFATRSPLRPNPVATTLVEVISIDHKKGTVVVDWIDAHHQTPVLDIKPFTPSEDQLTSYKVPEWCNHWPKTREESGEFPWEKEFNF